MGVSPTRVMLLRSKVPLLVRITKATPSQVENQTARVLFQPILLSPVLSCSSSPQLLQGQLQLISLQPRPSKPLVTNQSNKFNKRNPCQSTRRSCSL